MSIFSIQACGEEIWVEDTTDLISITVYEHHNACEVELSTDQVELLRNHLTKLLEKYT